MEYKNFKRWEEQGELKNLVKDAISNGASRDAVVSQICSAKSLPEDVVNQAVDQLLKDWLVFQSDVGDLKVSEQSHQSLIRATNQGDYPGALLFLMKNGVYHPDMERFGMLSSSDDSVDKNKKCKTTKKTSDKMPDYDKELAQPGLQSDSLVYKEVPEGAEKISSAVGSAITASADPVESEFSVFEIAEKTSTIDPSELAVEIGGWISSNVEQFIDNQETVFRMYLHVNSDMGMPISSLFQRLYLSVPDLDEQKGITDKVVNKLYDDLDAKLAEAKKILDEDPEFLGFLFNRMVFFYELTGLVIQDGKVQQALKQKMKGQVQINELIFDPITLTTTVAQGVGKNEDGKILESGEKVVVKKEDSPAGFGIEIEISVSPEGSASLSMY